MTPGRAPQKSRKRSRAAVAHWRRGRESLAAEFLCQQAPLIAITMTLGCAIALVEYGYIPGNGRPFQTAGVAVAIWRLIWMGVCTGYTMALVGQAAGIFALPYSTSVLGFSNPHVTPTMLVLTFISPFGALPGFRRSGQWNPALAAAACPGGAIGALTGPFVRATVLADPDVFRATLGVALALFGLQLCWKATRDLSQHGGSAGRDYLDDAGGNRFAIKTASLSWTSIEIHFGKYRHTLSNPRLFLVGAGVGLFSSALGAGGGFLLVPIFAMVYRIPLYVMVAATVPYTVVLSFVGILTFMFVLPAFGTAPIEPEWSWGFFTAAGRAFGSWCASKTQLHIPEHLLNWLLGGGTVIVGLLYVASFAIRLPFAL